MNTISKDFAQRLIAATRNGDPWNLMGRYNVKIRQAFMSELTGAKVPQAKSGVRALRSALIERLDIDTNDCLAVIDRNMVAKLASIANSQ